MEGLYLGLEINDSGCSAAVMDPQTKKVQTVIGMNQETLIPGLLCYDLETDRWIAGSAAKGYEGRDNCIILHKPVSLFKSGQTLDVNETEYSADDLLGFYLKGVVEWIREQSGQSQILDMSVCIENLSLMESERFMRLMKKNGFKASQVHLLNRQECFMHYVMSLSKEVWTNTSFLLDYNEKGLFLYRLTLKNSGVRKMVIIRQDHAEDITAVEELHKDQDTEEQTDLYLTEVVNSIFKGRVVNSLLLSGEGFQKLDWARNTIQTAAAVKSRKIFQISAVYCMGAACAAYHLSDAEQRFPYTVICEDHVSVEVSMNLDEKAGRKQMILIPCGTGYMEARAHIGLLLEEEQKLTLYIKNAGAADSKKQELDLAPLMEKNQDRIRISLNIAFVNDHEMLVQIVDEGFGEFFPSSGKSITQKFSV